MKNFISKLRIGDLTADIPIIQGGMGVGISMSNLASAVAEEGGIGVIASVGIGRNEPDVFTNYVEANKRCLRKEINKAKSASSGIIGVNVMVALSDFNDLVTVAVESEADMLLLGAGLPLKLPSAAAENLKIKLVPIISSARAANIICKIWTKKYGRVPDAVVVEGPLAGGHLGFKKEQLFSGDYALEKLIPGVLEVLKPYEEKAGKKIPVIAAGGIYTGEDIYKIMKLGASGVQMGTRFVTTYECDADVNFKKVYLNSRKEDIIIIDSPVGLPGRAIKNKFLEDINAGAKQKFSCPYKCLRTCDFKNVPYCIALALINAKKGNFEEGFAFAGSNAYRAEKIISVKELINILTEEYRAACKS